MEILEINQIFSSANRLEFITRFNDDECHLIYLIFDIQKLVKSPLPADVLEILASKRDFLNDTIFIDKYDKTVTLRLTDIKNEDLINIPNLAYDIHDLLSIINCKNKKIRFELLTGLFIGVGFPNTPIIQQKEENRLIFSNLIVN